MGRRAWMVLAVSSLFATWLLFVEYLPPLQSVGIHADIAGYHFPLLNFAWQELRLGRFPIWDPYIYCGIPFIGITQEALFYPPTWLVFAASALGRGMLLKSVEVLVMLHLWAGFLFCFAWLRNKVRHPLAVCGGAAAFALGGMPLSQLQHLGVVCCYIWIPLGLWGIDRARDSNSLKPYLTVALASAMAFLAGYPSTFAAYVLCVVAWSAVGTRPVRNFTACLAALCFAAVLSAVQLIPSLETNAFRYYERSYGGELPHRALTYLLPFLPNYFDGSRPEFGVLAWGDYFYVGAAVVLGTGCTAAALIRRRMLASDIAAPLLVIVIALVVISNPAGLVDSVVTMWPSLAAVLREYNLFPCITVMLCFLGALGLDWLLAGVSLKLPRSFGVIVPVLVLAWCVRMLLVARPGGLEFASGWFTLADLVVSMALCGVLLCLIADIASRRYAAVAFVVLVLVELQSFGINRRFNAETGHKDKHYRALRDMRTGGHTMAGMEQKVFEQIRHDRFHRVLFMDGLNTLEAHYYGLLTPQGFEASLPAKYREKVARYTPWQTNRLFTPDLSSESFLRDFGVRYVICIAKGETAGRAAASPHLRPLGDGDHFFRVFEYTAAEPTYRWNGSVTAREWLPAKRVFDVTSENGGSFALLEQNLNGWTAQVDGARVPITSFNDVFQSASIPAGAHRIVFEYRPQSVRWGAFISLAALAAFIVLCLYTGRSRTA